MKVLIALVVIRLWVFCGKKAHDAALGQLTYRFPDQCHEPWVTIWAYSGGPISLAMTKLNPISEGKPMSVGYTKEQRWAAFREKYPNQDCEGK